MKYISITELSRRFNIEPYLILKAMNNKKIRYKKIGKQRLLIYADAIIWANAIHEKFYNSKK